VADCRGIVPERRVGLVRIGGRWSPWRRRLHLSRMVSSGPEQDPAERFAVEGMGLCLAGEPQQRGKRKASPSSATQITGRRSRTRSNRSPRPPRCKVAAALPEARDSGFPWNPLRPNYEPHARLGQALVLARCNRGVAEARDLFGRKSATTFDERLEGRLRVPSGHAAECNTATLSSSARVTQAPGQRETARAVVIGSGQ